MLQTARQKKKQPFFLTKRDDEILQAVFDFRGLTAQQVTRLFYSPGSMTFVRVNLLELVQKKYLSRFHYPTVTRGTSPFLYTLTTKALRSLASRGVDIEGYRPLKSDDYYFLSHLLTLNDFLLAMRLLVKQRQDITLSSCLHEWQLRRTPVTALVGSRKLTLVPDAWSEVRVLVKGKPYHIPIWTEMDLGSEWGKRFKQKLMDIITVVTGNSIEQRFAVKHPTIAFLTPSTEKRRDLMREHMREVLKEMGKEQFASLFLFASLPTLLDPQHVFLAPVWYTPANDTPLPLLDLSEE